MVGSDKTENGPAPTVSIVIPIRDAAAHLEECLDSVTAQTILDLEIICVDDASTDGSSDILERVAPLCGPGSRVLAMKGRLPQDEVAAVQAPWRVVATRDIAVPELAEARSLVVLELAPA